LLPFVIETLNACIGLDAEDWIFQEWEIYRDEPGTNERMERGKDRHARHTGLIAVSSTGYSSAGCFPAEPASASPDEEMESKVVGIVKSVGKHDRRFQDDGIRQGYIVAYPGDTVDGPTESDSPVHPTDDSLAARLLIEPRQLFEFAYMPDHELFDPDANDGPTAHRSLYRPQVLSEPRRSKPAARR
jgi:hypothetical protein